MTSHSDVPSAEAATSSRYRTFRALRHRSYRFIWLGQIGNSASLWIEQVIRPLLIHELTGSALLVGAVFAARMVPQLAFGLVAGAVADRYDKRRVLLATQAVTMAMQLVMGLLVVTNVVQPWQVFATAAVTGSSNAFMIPVRTAMIPRLVPRSEILNALALNNVANNTMRVAGTGVAGALLIAFDYGEIYLLDAAIYMGVMVTTIFVRMPPPEATPSRRKHVFGDLLHGFRYVSGNRAVLYLIGAALILYIFAQPYQQVFIPLIAVDTLQLERSVVGYMLATTGAGALVGSLLVASLPHVPRRGLVLMGVLILFSLALILVAQSTWLPATYAALAVAGAAGTTYFALNNALLIEHAEPEFHGRVLSLLSLDRGLISVGAVVGGALSESWGPQLGLTAMAATALVLTALVVVFVPSLRRIR